MGKLIVLEGTDGCGKSTQYARLGARLAADGIDFRKLAFPQYQEESSALIRMYLSGAFGPSPDDVNAFAASTFYAVDRYASYACKWKDYYQAGGVLLADRYTTSNAIYQAGKEPPEKRAAFLEWLYDLEYEKLGLPRPDLTLLLDMPAPLAAQLRKKREQATGTGPDIHEQDEAYLTRCRALALDVAARSGWVVIPCAKDGAVLPVEEISNAIYTQVQACLEG